MTTLLIDEKPGAEPSDRPTERPMPFFPDFALREALVALLFLTILFLVASITTPGLEAEADPASAGYVPHPEWYFLWLFQLLKYFKGNSEVIGTFVLPTAGIALLALLPFLDRRQPHPHRLLPRTRPVRILPRLAAAGILAGVTALTVAAVTSSAPMTDVGPQLTQVQAAGQALFNKMGCGSCHTIGDVGGKRGPDLTTFGNSSDAGNRVLLHFAGIDSSTDSIMPGYQLSDEELNSLAAYLLSLKER